MINAGYHKQKRNAFFYLLLAMKGILCTLFMLTALSGLILCMCEAKEQLAVCCLGLALFLLGIGLCALLCREKRMKYDL